MTGHDIPEDYLSGYALLLAEASATGRRLTRDEIESRRALGERAANAGHGLRALVSAHLSAARAAWPTTPGSADSTLAAIQQVIDAFAEGYERAQFLAVRKEEAARREFIDDLLYGRSDLGRLAERAERFGLRLSHAHAVAVAQGTTAYDEGAVVPRQVEQALIARFGDRNILLTTKHGRMLCVAPGDQDDVLTYFAKRAYAATDGGRIAIGRPQPGPGGVVQSYEEALNTLELAERLELDDPVLRAADLLVYPVLTRDRQAMADLVLDALGPLTTARGGAQVLLDTLTAYFDCGCVAAEAARRLSLSVRALTYRLERIHKLTGANPADPAHRYMLQTAVIGARLLNWPAQSL
ncbi:MULTISPECIES: PucR family transcriptional regulator [Streptomyces]|uniref:PucR family transcriptional regulator n=1 Tax=Streptomyces TaxID=1883 RepID=UPI000BC58645|nr:MULTISPECIES: helix-turn-helix domain-containing protein [Streptomyces]MCX4612391.1 helix-turn-helix domain-containing protein [Streptomyces mirabilis]MCX5352616.1 helix-turn-helix domain-containing protein [Streptomyces mirabilis]NMI61577.1 PucR family transcriptional regulator [Streptomyces sp. RLA2-12]QDN60664.1 PucR family transcriptional regulator [Streptomyces sp. S1D4-20]QDN70718.1 PucR family transcriptional regulator [Streptomyces sp. S1D4-14]